MITRIWFSFFLISFLSACVLYFTQGHSAVFGDMVQSLFSSSKQSVEIIIGLVGSMCFWLGMFEIAKQAHLIEKISLLFRPLFKRIMPEVPANHPAHGSITMNLAANILGLDNAATPMGLQAMRDLQSLNPVKDTATNAQILFVVLNGSIVILLPTSIFMYRAQFGSPNPALVFMPILMATSISMLVGFLSVAFIQKIKIWQPVVLAYLLSFCVFISGVILYFSSLSDEQLVERSQLFANVSLLSIVMVFLSYAMWKKVDVYASFIKGAKHGVMISVKILPYLVAMLTAVALLRASHVLDFCLNGVAAFVRWCGLNDAFVPALTTAFMRPLSGSGSRATMLETMQHYGVDSFPGLISAVVQGSTDTTLYVLAVYFGSVGLIHGRHTLGCALLADFAGITSAILLCYWFFM